MRLKTTKTGLLFSLAIGFLFLVKAASSQTESSGAIAIRVEENPLHYSALRWYQSQNFQGSPQALKVDGYDAIRNGRTVYINTANISDSNNDGSLDFLQNNILIISHSQENLDTTQDILGQLLKNFELNTNLSEPGTCNKTIAKSCLKNEECPTGEYCNSKKAKIIRDVKRLADLETIKYQLEKYKARTKKYPSIPAGTYLANTTISTWSSWQKNLGQTLGVNLPLDPINKLGDCSGFDATTCWNPETKRFAADLSQSQLPSGSHVYLYSGDSQGNSARYCTQMESGYSNIASYNCFSDTAANRQPVINNVNLSGRPGTEFIGYVSISDPDGDTPSLSIDLASPDANTWTAKKWQWAPGFNKFSVLPTSDPKQKKIYALKTGDTAISGYYKIRLNLNDGKGTASSIFSKVYDLTINPFPITLGEASKTVVIGSGTSLSISGTDSNGTLISNLTFKNASYNSSPLTQAELAAYGLTLSGMNLNGIFKSAQRTGTYTVNVYAIDPIKTTSRVDSSFIYSVINNPPVFQRLTATFSNKTSQVCSPSDKCSIAVDNGEAATIEIKGSDPDGHRLSYSLIDTFEGKLAINSSTGIITGLEKLNSQELNDRDFNIGVKISDEYCNNSQPEECSNIYYFNLTVKKYCSIGDSASTLKASVSQTFTIKTSGEKLETGLTLSDCSAIGASKVDIKLVGESHSQAIVFVSDLSKSMDTNVLFNGVSQAAITRLKNALTATNTGFFDRIYNTSKTWPSKYFIKIALIGYNQSVTSFQDLVDLALPGSLTNLKSTVNNYSTGFETNTLTALNKAEETLAKISDVSVEKIIILMSDGIPGVDGWEITSPSCYNISPPQCQCGGEYPSNCVVAPTCPLGTFQLGCTLATCYTPRCACGGEYPNRCTPAATCPDGQYQGGCDLSDCYTPIHSSFNNLIKIKRFFSRLLGINSAQAITEQSKCKFKYCAQAFPDFNCQSNQQMTCRYEQKYDCDLSSDVDIEAKALKDAGISLYTIYYNTSGSLVPKQKMCDWSSNNGANCDNNTYSFAGTDINAMISRVLGRVVTKPKDIIVGSSPVIDSEPTQTTSIVDDALINGLSCGTINPTVTFVNNGYLEFSNLEINYCPAKLHP